LAGHLGPGAKGARMVHNRGCGRQLWVGAGPLPPLTLPRVAPLAFGLPRVAPVAFELPPVAPLPRRRGHALPDCLVKQHSRSHRDVQALHRP
jgi:hypothetical protein